MMHPSAVFWLTLTGLSLALADTPSDSAPVHTQAIPQVAPTYNVAQTSDNVATYVGGAYTPPGAQYGNYEAGYGSQNPALYDYMVSNNNYPQVKNTEIVNSDPISSMGYYLPMFRQVLGLLMKMVVKIGFLFLGSVGILVVGMAFTTAVCSLTPFCTISFMNGSVSQETVRSLLTPDKITATAHFVQQAIDKYQKLQNAIE